jgi:leucyl-tRNA synthetase
VMSVPAHDQRDWEFATKYKLPIIQVVAIKDEDQADISQAAYSEKNTLINSAEYTGLSFEAGFNAIAEKLQSMGKGKKTVNYRLRDWGVSRQRYWGAPIPIVNDENGNAFAVNEQDLPVVLPEDVVMDGVTSPIKSDPSWSQTTHNGKPVTRETDTFDTFMESSWYYARYASAPSDAMLNPDEANYWLPADQYIGGIEHAILHLLYARFFHKLLRDEGLVDSDEPFKRLLCQGMVLSDAFYSHDKSGKEIWHNPDDLSIQTDDKGRIQSAFVTANKEPVTHAGKIKMSKSKNNGIDPQSVIDLYGADTIRLYTMFASPPEQDLEWTESAVEGANRFLRRFWRLATDHLQSDLKHDNAYKVSELSKDQKALRLVVHSTIQKVTDDLLRRQTFNTAIAKLMELLNFLQKYEVKDANDYALMHEAVIAMTKMLNPITPHICEALWAQIGLTEPLQTAQWPQYDSSALVQDEKLVIVQVNGKLRAKLNVPADISKDDLQALALGNDNVHVFIEGKQVRKVIVVPGKLVNIVAN